MHEHSDESRASLVKYSNQLAIVTQSDSECYSCFEDEDMSTLATMPYIDKHINVWIQEVEQFIVLMTLHTYEQFQTLPLGDISV